MRFAVYFVAALVVAPLLLRSPAASAQYAQEDVLRASDRASDDQFGHDIDISGDTAIISILGRRASAPGAGGAYIFVRDAAGRWNQQAFLEPELDSTPSFGRAVAVEGDTAFVGAQFDRTLGTFAGAVFVYTRSGTRWSLSQKVLASDGAAFSNFGESLDVDGARLVVGTTRNDGVVYVFEERAGEYVETARLTESDVSTNSLFGRSVAVDGDTLAVGAPSDDRTSSTTENSGAVFVFERSGASYTRVAKLRPSVSTASYLFGNQIALDGDTLVATTTYRFIVAVFRRGAAWAEEAVIPLEPGDEFTGDVALTGEVLAIGGSVLVGSVRTPSLFQLERTGASWSRGETLFPEVSGGATFFGRALASTGGQLLARVEDSSRTGSVVAYRQALAANGQACDAPGECASGFCADGVCCDAACAGGRDDCYSCRGSSTGMADGECAPLTAGRSCGDPSATACDGADTCDGAGVCEDNLARRGASCGDSSVSDCDGADTCDGAGVCEDNLARRGASCGDPSASECDEADACDGAGGCDRNYAAAGARCGEGATMCSAQDTCDASGRCRANDRRDGARCAAGTFCLSEDSCRAGVCREGTTPACADELKCVEEEMTCVEPCGDGELDEGEECDEGMANSDTRPDACRSGCTLATCGDGVTDTGESCDEGRDNSDAPGATCRSNCSLASCGDGVVDEGEECDEGAGNENAPDACRETCVDPACGDGIVDTDEACDEGAMNSDAVADACRRDCSEARCGDGVVDAGEECDDDTDDCSDDCTRIAIADAGMDDAGADAGDAGDGDAGGGDAGDGDAGGDAGDAGVDANTDTGVDSGTDAGAPVDDGGCGCRAASSSDAGIGVFMVLALFARRRGTRSDCINVRRR